MTRLSPFNLNKWLEENRHLLVPPLGNKLLYDGQFKVMLVAGPNSRTDYHVEKGEEWFYQLKGELVLKVIENGDFYDVPLSSGDTFCLPAGIPHSPQRGPDSLGIVVERERKKDEIDAMEWYCQNESCRKLLHRREFFCESLEKDLSPVIAEYFADEKKRTCEACGFIERPAAPVNS